MALKAAFSDERKAPALSTKLRLVAVKFGRIERVMATEAAGEGKSVMSMKFEKKKGSEERRECMLRGVCVFFLSQVLLFPLLLVLFLVFVGILLLVLYLGFLFLGSLFINFS